MRLNDLQNKSVVLVGFEATNRSLFVELRRRFPMLPVEIRDMRMGAKVPNDPHVRTVLGETYLKGLDAFDLIIRSPGVPYHPELQALRPRVTTSVNLFFDEVRSNTRAKIIAVTGTKGKSTTASLIAHMLKTAGRNALLLGNIDVQEWDHLTDITDETCIVYEMSSYMLEDFDGWPDVAAIVSAFPDHLDWHGDYPRYIAAKANITARQGEGDVFLYHAGYDELVRIAKQTKAQRVAVGVDSSMHWEGEWFYDGALKILPTSTLHLPGDHNKDNALMALAIAKQLQIPFDVVGRAFETFKGLEHRLEVVATVNNVTYVNDAISTTPESTMAAIRACQENLPSPLLRKEGKARVPISQEQDSPPFEGGVRGGMRANGELNGVLPPVGSIVLGGLDRGYDYDLLADLIVERAIPHVVLLPGARDKIKTSLMRAGYRGQVHEAESMDAVVALCVAHTPPHGVCLLSTAAPSYDLFTNFKDKGNRFKKAVLALR